MAAIAAVWFNKTCRERESRPNFINIRINGNNRQCNNTMEAAVRFHLNQEIKFMYRPRLCTLLPRRSKVKAEAVNAFIIS
jgi:hypothetical protein